MPCSPIRCPIHGFIEPTDWEVQVVSQPAFQRLRRIRQLSWTDMVYPGAMHTRFEHSLGVMHTAGLMLEAVWKRAAAKLLASGMNAAGKERLRVLVRFASLLHDVGHAPFSHAGEDLFPIAEDGKPYTHEQYSAAIIRHLLTDAIEDHPENQNFGIKAAEVADFIEGRTSVGRWLFWRLLISSQLDADRTDYLLRDSYHIGVEYGKFDLHRLLNTLAVSDDPEAGGLVLAVEEGGLHVAEALIIARYMMFTQVYFHKTRVAYDKHFAEALKAILQEDRGAPTLPPPTSRSDLEEYIAWSDWNVVGALQAGRGGAHGEALRSREHLRLIFQTSEVATDDELELVDSLEQELQHLEVYRTSSTTSGYKYPDNEVIILTEKDGVVPLSELSTVVKGLRNLRIVRLYVPHAMRDEAIKIEKRLRSGGVQ